jgi:hypothetical protein
MANLPSGAGMLHQEDHRYNCVCAHRLTVRSLSRNYSMHISVPRHPVASCYMALLVVVKPCWPMPLPAYACRSSDWCCGLLDKPHWIVARTD